MRITSLLMLGIGYVLGSRAGRTVSTSSPRWSNARHNGSNSSAEPAGSVPPRGSIRLALGRDRSLAEGMAITAAIDARLLGMRLLNLRAAIDVVPAEASQTVDDLSARRVGFPIGAGLPVGAPRPGPGPDRPGAGWLRPRVRLKPALPSSGPLASGPRRTSPPP